MLGILQIICSIDHPTVTSPHLQGVDDGVGRLPGEAGRPSSAVVEYGTGRAGCRRQVPEEETEIQGDLRLQNRKIGKKGCLRALPPPSAVLLDWKLFE